MPRGGCRPGAGRKKGAAEVRTRRIANELARDGLTPLEVMVATMRELWQHAQSAATPAERLEGQRAACAVARDAAPYIHPRLAVVRGGGGAVGTSVGRGFRSFGHEIEI